MNETQFKYKCSQKLKALGYLVVRLRATDPTGMPDLMALKNKSVIFIETKTPVGNLSAIQTNTIKRLEDHGFKVLVVSDLNQIV